MKKMVRTYALLLALLCCLWHEDYGERFALAERAVVAQMTRALRLCCTLDLQLRARAGDAMFSFPFPLQADEI